MLSIEKMENRAYVVYRFCFKYICKKTIFAIFYDKTYKKLYIISEAKEFLQNFLNIKSYRELDEVSRILEAKIKEIVRKYFKRNNYEVNEIEKILTNILKDLEAFLKDFLLLQSI